MDEVPLPDKFYAEVPVKVEVVGDYHTVARFFDELSRLPRIVHVQDMRIGDPKTVDEDTMVTVTGQIMTYRWLSWDESIPDLWDMCAGISPPNSVLQYENKIDQENR